MSWWWHRLRTLVLKSLFRRARADQDLDEEIRFHLAQEAQLRAERGLPPEEAQRAARRAFGSVLLVTETTRAVWVSTAVEQLLQDLRSGTRILTKSPALSATAVTLVALVIGGNTTVFSIAHSLLEKPAPGVHGTGLVTISWVDDKGRMHAGSRYIDYQSLMAQSATVRPMIASKPFFGRFTLSHQGGSYVVSATPVSHAYFHTLGVRLVRGRSFTKRDDTPGPSGVAVVISHRTWQDYFQGTGNIVGMPVTLDGHPAIIVGVAEPAFRGTILAESTDVWVPLLGYARAVGKERSLLSRLDYGVAIHGRLAPGVSLPQANAELSTIWKRLQATHPDPRNRKVRVVSYSATAAIGTAFSVHGDRALAVFSIITLLTLVIVCANVANLLLARGVIRQRELALRQSLGASRVRIVRMLLAEGLVIALLATSGALLFAWWVSRAIPSFFPQAPGWSAIALMDFTPDWMVILYAVVLAGVAVVAFSVAPAFRAWRLSLLPWLKAGEQAVVAGRSRLSRSLVIIQLAFSVLLLTCAGLVYRSLSLMDNRDPGFNTHNLLFATVTTAGSATTPDTNFALLETLREQLRRVRGVEEVTYARQAPMREAGWLDHSVRAAESGAEQIRAEVNYVGPNYIHVLGLAPVAGRELAPEDRTRRTRSAVVSRNLAEALWPGSSPLGRSLLVRRPGDESEPAAGVLQEVEVVGVAPDGFFSRFYSEHRRFVFLSAQQNPAPPGETTFNIRYTGSLDLVAPAIRRALRNADARTPIVAMMTADRTIETLRWPLHALTTLLVMFAAGSLLIAGIGQYAVVSFDTRRRIRELGLRIALGASSRQILSLVVRESLRLTIVGLTIGFALSVAAGNAIGGVLYGVTPTDALTYVAVFGLLSVASLVACWLPARRAACIDPITTLRQE